MTLADKFAEGFKWNTAATIICAILQFTYVVILARLLTPFEFGLFAICMIWMRIATSILDVGLTNAIVQTDNLNNRKWFNLFALQHIIGWFLFLISFFIIPLVAPYVNSDVRLIDLFKALSLVFFNISLRSGAPWKY